MHKMQLTLLAILVCIYSIPLHAKTSVDITISGIDDILETNVRLLLSIEQQKEHALLSSARVLRLHKKAPAEITSALQPFGYYQPVIKADLIQTTPSHWQASYDIDPGPATIISEFNFSITEEVSKDQEYNDFIQNNTLLKDSVFNHIEYEKFKASLSKLATERGYFEARFEQHRVEIDINTNEAKIYLNYNAGQRYNFGEVSIKQDVLDEIFLRRYISFTKGSPYTLAKLIDLQHALNDSDYFSSVEVYPGKPKTDQHEIPVSVILKPHKPHRYTIGLGYGTDTGARAKFGWQMPRINSSGHRFDTEAKISKIGYSLSARYRVPILNPRTDQMIYSAAIINEETTSSDSTIQTIGASLNRSRGAWRESISLNYQEEDYEIADTGGDSTLLIPSVNWSRTWGKNFIYAIDGLRFDLSLRGASENLISDTDFSQLQGGIKAINSINNNNRFIFRGNLGSTWTSEFDQLPSSIRFFAGGAQSVRGYSYESLGPLDANGNVIGGQHLMVGSIEFEHSFDNKWGMALFYDGGNALEEFSDDLERGAGFGVRWKSPVGMVRIDLASALTEDGTPWRLHINIGPDL
ncbi:MAG: autotransporter assembly complex protein TamA [Gammaproteobacteria bacterium]|nr:autotransporter assembly complex protein TamA [Gammaproteobacteria bacterium]